MGYLLVVIAMTHVFKRSLGAATALSAVLALGSASAFAQDAVPLDSPESITAPATVSPAPPVIAPVAPTVTLPQTTSAPTIVLPEVTAPAAAPATMPEAAAPENRASAASTAPAARTSGNATARTAAPANNAEPAAETPASGEILPAPVIPADPIPEAAPESAMEPVAPVAETAAPAEPASDGNTALAGLAALLGLVALGGAGFMLMRRRKPVNEAEPEMELTEAQAIAPEVMEPARPVHVPPAPVLPIRTPEPTVTHAAPAPLDANGKPVSPFIWNPVYQGKRPEERPVFAMPAGPVPTGERRAALLNQMVASHPDAANPFTSPKWRMRRARTLLSKREKMLREQATRPFDFRDFGTHAIKPYRPAQKPPVPHMA